MILSALASFLFFYIERTWIFSICLINHYYTYNCCVTYIHSFLFSWYFKNMCCFFFSLYVKKEKRQGQKQSVSEPCYTGQHEKTSQQHFLTIKANKAILVVIQNTENIKSLTWKWEYYVSFKSSSWWRPKMEWKDLYSSDGQKHNSKWWCLTAGCVHKDLLTIQYSFLWVWLNCRALTDNIINYCSLKTKQKVSHFEF